MATILVVDDNLAVARVLARLLQQKGHRALTAGDGPTALQSAHDEHPDLILLDMMMPEMDGLEVLRRLKADPVTSEPPVILFSAVDDPKLVAAAMRSGAREYWIKASFNFEELPRRLARHLPPPQATDEPVTNGRS
jgi:CheY-like chemotaxis protein